LFPKPYSRSKLNKNKDIMVKIIIFAKRVQICLEAIGIDENKEKLD
jgi:hypothetical protein